MPTDQVRDFLVSYSNSTEFNQLKKEIFDYHTYYFETEVSSPLIFDLGAHIGLSTLYFKMIYPGSHVVAVEPNPASFALLQENARQNYLEQVTLLPYAISATSGTEQLHIDNGDEWYSTASFFKGAWTRDQPTLPIQVPTETLNELITRYATDRPVDLVKMDIEGAEFLVLTKAAEELTQIKELIVEYHPQPGQSLAPLIAHLKKYGLLLTTELTSSPKESGKLQLLHFQK